MINGGPSYEYTFNVDNHTISSSSYSVYYIHSQDDLEYVVRYQDTEESDYRKEHTRKEG